MSISFQVQFPCVCLLDTHGPAVEEFQAINHLQQHRSFYYCFFFNRVKLLLITAKSNKSSFIFVGTFSRFLQLSFTCSRNRRRGQRDLRGATVRKAETTSV